MRDDLSDTAVRGAAGSADHPGAGNDRAADRAVPCRWNRGELRIVDETTGAIIIRFPLNEDPEEGDCQQPLPEA